MTSASPLGTNVLPWFTVLALAVGAAPLAVNPSEVTHPRLIVAALIGLALFMVGARTLSVLRKRLRLRCALEVVALLLFAVSIAAASGGVRSSSLPLLILPLTGAGMLLSRPVFALIAMLVILAYTVLGLLTPGMQIGSPMFIVHLIGTIAPVLIATGAIAMLMTQMQAAERQIRDLSTSDALTGLHNAAAFERRLSAEHRNAERMGRPYSIILIGVDNLEQLNQSDGQEAGNRMLTAVSVALQRAIRSSDVAARLSGSEFAVLLSDADAVTANTISHRIRTATYAGTISVGNRLVRANVSAGVANFPKDRLSLAEVRRLAEQRLQQDRSTRVR